MYKQWRRILTYTGVAASVIVGVMSMRSLYIPETPTTAAADSFLLLSVSELQTYREID